MGNVVAAAAGGGGTDDDEGSWYPCVESINV